MPITLIVIVAIIGITIVVFAQIAAQKRREEMATLATQLGLRFDPSSDHGHDEEFGHFEIFRRGHSRVARNRLTGMVQIGDRSYELDAGDFRYKRTSRTGKDRRTSTYRFSYMILQLPFDTPELLIRPEGFFDKLAGVFGFDDIDFESEEFSRRFHVKSSDKRFAYDVIHPAMMELLLRKKPPMLDIENNRICLSDGNRIWSPDEFRSSLHFLNEFFEAWPKHLWKEINA